MSHTVERNHFDLRFQPYRLRNPAREARLLASIAQRGIEQPLTGVDLADGRQLLLDGFQRYRCAAKLGIDCVPYVSLGTDEAEGIARLLETRAQTSLNILEQARFVVELLTTHQLSAAEVAERLSRSKAWVSTRRNLWSEMSPAVQAILFRGEFPVYSYMVTLRPFMRMNGVRQSEITRFVQQLAGKQRSVRELELLAHGYFRGPQSLRAAVDSGQWQWSLQQLQQVPEDIEPLNDCERGMLRDLERLLQTMQQFAASCHSPRLKSRDFFAQANLLAAGVLSRRESFFTQLEEFYDRSGQAECHLSTPSNGDATARNQPPPAGQSQHRAGDRQTTGEVGASRAEGQAADRQRAARPTLPPV